MSEPEHGAINGPGIVHTQREANVRVPGGARAFILTDEERVAFDADPDGWAALKLGCVSRSEYREWVALDGTALCGARTSKGKPCRQSVGGRIQLPVDQWRTAHRIKCCAAHAERQTRSA